MNIRTTVKNDNLTFEWDKKLRYVEGNSIFVKYDTDISGVPEHVFDFMFGVLMGEVLAWDEHDVEFGEMTSEEVSCLNDIIGLVRAVNSKGQAEGLPGIKVTTKNMVTVTEHSLTGTGMVLAANGMGKDGLTLMALLKEIGAEFRCFTVANQYEPPELFGKIHTHIKEYYRSQSVSDNIMETNFCQVTRYRIVPWWLFALPLAYAYGARTVLAVGYLEEMKLYEGTGLPVRALSHVVTNGWMREATGVDFNSPLWGLSDFGVMRLFVERYGHLVRYQHSCMKGFEPCNGCGKCQKIMLWFKAIGYDPKGYGLNLDCDDSSLKGNEVIVESIKNVRRRLRGENYGRWIDMINETSQGYAWKDQEGRVTRILAEHFEGYNYDPGADGFGLLSVPSLWGDLRWRNGMGDRGIGI